MPVGKVEEKNLKNISFLDRGTDPGNRIHTKMSRIPKTGIRDKYPASASRNTARHTIAMLRIHDILVQIRILGSKPLVRRIRMQIPKTHGSNPNADPEHRYI